MKMEQTECSETSAYKLQTPGNYPEENIKHSQHGGSLKSRSSNIPARVYRIEERHKIIGLFCLNIDSKRGPYKHAA
jgi:hypothetical protein